MSTEGHQDGRGRDAIGSVGGAIHKYQRGDGTELGELLNACFGRLLMRARRRLDTVAHTDPEGVVQSAIGSFLAAARNGRFPELRHRDELERLLVVILSRKSSHTARDLGTKRAGGGRVRNEPRGGLDVEGLKDGRPMEEAICREWLAHMEARGHGDAARLIRDGCHFDEIARTLQMSEAKARRLITLVHKETRIFFHLEEKPRG